MTENNVAACLMIYLVSQFFQSADSLLAGANRQAGSCWEFPNDFLATSGPGRDRLTVFFEAGQSVPLCHGILYIKKSFRARSALGDAPGSAGHSAIENPISSTSIITR